MQEVKETKLVAEPKETKMVADHKQVRMVKLKILTDCIRPGTDMKFVEGKPMGSPQYLKKGTIVELPEDEARELLAFVSYGNFSFAGERFDGEQTRHVIKRAELTL